jgi:hypothetical protein
MPFAKVEVELPVMFSALAAIPPVKVDVAVPETVKFVAVVVPSCERPVTERDVEVAFVARRLVNIELVACSIEANSEVDVALVNVPLVALKSEVKNEVEVELVMFELVP